MYLWMFYIHRSTPHVFQHAFNFSIQSSNPRSSWPYPLLPRRDIPRGDHILTDQPLLTIPCEEMQHLQLVTKLEKQFVSSTYPEASCLSYHHIIRARLSEKKVWRGMDQILDGFLFPLPWMWRLILTSESMQHTSISRIPSKFLQWLIMVAIDHPPCGYW